MSDMNKDRRLDDSTRNRERNVVRDGGVARSEADMADVSRDTYSTPIGPGGSQEPGETREEDRERAREVLGLGGAPVPQTDEDRRIAASSDPGRRRRSDDIVERESEPRDSVGGPDSPRGITVQD